MISAELAPGVRTKETPWRFVLVIVAELSPCTEQRLFETIEKRVRGQNDERSQASKFFRLQQYLSELKRLGLIILDRGIISITTAGLHFLSQPFDPTMEEILASIRRIISDDGSSLPRQRTSPHSQRDEKGLEGEADDKIINDIPRVLSGSDPAFEEEEDLLDLTAELGGAKFIEGPDIEPVAEAQVTASAPVQQPVQPKPAEESPPPSRASAPQTQNKLTKNAPARKVSAPGAHRAAASSWSPLEATVEDGVKDMLRPLIRRWLNENMSRVMTEALRDERGHAAVIGEAMPMAMRRTNSPRNRRWLNSRTAEFSDESGQLMKTPPVSDLVDASVFASKDLPTGSQGLVQVFLHKPDQREIVRQLAGQVDPEALMRGKRTLFTEISHGQVVEVVIEGRGLEVDEERQKLIWRGVPCSCEFTITVPSGAAGKVFYPVVLIFLGSVPIGSLKFAVRATDHDRAPLEMQGTRFRRYRRAFLSYASADRADVLRGAQLLQNVGIDFFNDLLSLEPGDRWARRLFEEIDRSDVFLLFWSSHAKASEWVHREINYALARQTASAENLPDIRLLILEGPPPPKPPDELKHLHFDDRLMYVLAALKSEAGARALQ